MQVASYAYFSWGDRTGLIISEIRMSGYRGRIAWQNPLICGWIIAFRWCTSMGRNNGLIISAIRTHSYVWQLVMRESCGKASLSAESVFIFFFFFFFLSRGIILCIELPWPENQVNTCARHGKMWEDMALEVTMSSVKSTDVTCKTHSGLLATQLPWLVDLVSLVCDEGW